MALRFQDTFVNQSKQRKSEEQISERENMKQQMHFLKKLEYDWSVLDVAPHLV